MLLVNDKPSFIDSTLDQVIPPVRRPLQRPTVSVIIPTLNEARNLPLLLPYLPMDWIDEVILVDGRSTDCTIEVAQELMPTINIVRETRKGKGAAMKAGYQAAQGDILVLLDADGSNDPREIPRYVKALIEGADFVKGSRFAVGGGTTDMPRIRKMGNNGFVLLSNLLFDGKFTDLCYGYHAFWRYCLDVIDLEAFDGFEIDTALYLQAKRKKLRLLEVPSFEGYRFYGEGKLQTIPDGFRVLKTIFKEWVAYLRMDEPRLHLGFRGVAPVSGRDDMQIMRLLGMLMASGFNQDGVLNAYLQLATEILGAESASILILDEHGKIKGGRVSFQGQLQEPQTHDIDDVVELGLAGWVVRNRQAALVHNTMQDPRWLARDWDHCAECGRSVLALPLTLRGQVLAVITMAHNSVGRFTEDDLFTLQRMAQVS